MKIKAILPPKNLTTFDIIGLTIAELQTLYYACGLVSNKNEYATGLRETARNLENSIRPIMQDNM